VIHTTSHRQYQNQKREEQNVPHTQFAPLAKCIFRMITATKQIAHSASSAAR
jgi:hypothetical protein